MIDYFNKFQDVLHLENKSYCVGNDTMWKEYENENKLILPTDFKYFINHYGSGVINEFTWILNPFEEDCDLNFEQKTKAILEAYQTTKNEFPAYFPFEVFPSKNGILPFGFTANGDELYWKTSEQIDKWSIVIYMTRSDEYFEFEMSFCEFFYKLIIGDIHCELLKDEDNLFEGNAIFIPYSNKQT